MYELVLKTLTETPAMYTWVRGVLRWYELVVKSLTETSENATYWSVGSMAVAVGVTRSFVSGCGGPSI